MSNEKTYNGYSNYETWNICLWLNNDEGLYRDYLGIMNRSIDLHRFADSIENMVTSYFEEFDGFGDLKSSRELSRVDWDEVAESLADGHFDEDNEEMQACND